MIAFRSCRDPIFPPNFFPLFSKAPHHSETTTIPRAHTVVVRLSLSTSFHFPFRPIYPCPSEDRFSSWTQRSRYICRPLTISPKSVVYSFGAEPHNTFEVGLYVKRQPEIHLFDATLPTHLQLKLQRMEELHFHNVGVGVRDGGGVATLKVRGRWEVGARDGGLHKGTCLWKGSILLYYYIFTIKYATEVKKKFICT